MSAPGDKAEIPLKGSEPGEYGPDVEALATQLMSATKNGDRQAFDELTRSLRQRAFSVARSLVGSHEDALDLTQEAFLKTYRARDTYRDGDPFLPWFHRILRNTCFSFLRKHKRLKKHSLSSSRTGQEGDESDWEIVDENPGPSAAPELEETSAAFWHSFRKLGSNDREILTLRHFQDLAYRDIARSLNIPEGTVMSRLFHARRRLREHLRPYLQGALEDYAESLPSAPPEQGDSR